MHSPRGFEFNRNLMRQSSSHFDQKSLVFDLEFIFAKRLEINSFIQFEKLCRTPNFKNKYILASMPYSSHCCEKKHGVCFCHLYLFEMRPYAYEFLRILRNSYEFICCSRLPSEVVRQLVF